MAKIAKFLLGAHVIGGMTARINRVWNRCFFIAMSVVVAVSIISDNPSSLAGEWNSLGPVAPDSIGMLIIDPVNPNVA